jgi:hypothetical protein
VDDRVFAKAPEVGFADVGGATLLVGALRANTLAAAAARNRQTNRNQ